VRSVDARPESSFDKTELRPLQQCSKPANAPDLFKARNFLVREMQMDSPGTGALRSRHFAVISPGGIGFSCCPRKIRLKVIKTAVLESWDGMVRISFNGPGTLTRPGQEDRNRFYHCFHFACSSGYSVGKQTALRYGSLRTGAEGIMRWYCGRPPRPQNHGRSGRPLGSRDYQIIFKAN
jgi:hypothetical protein